MKLNGTYQLDGAEFINPDLLIMSDGVEIFPNEMAINVTIQLSVTGAQKGSRLEGVPVNNLNYDPESLALRVVEYLDENNKIN